MSMLDSAKQSEREGEKIDSLREWLLSRKVPSSVCDALDEQDVSKEEIVTYTEQDLIDLSNLLNLNVVIRKRFINAVKAIPNAVSSIDQNQAIVFLGNEEKQQMGEFKTMIKNLKQHVTTTTNELKECDKNCENMKKEVNKVYDDIQTMVEQARKEDLQQFSYQHTDFLSQNFKNTTYVPIANVCIFVFVNINVHINTID